MIVWNWGRIAYIVKKLLSYMIIGLISFGIMGVLIQHPIEGGFEWGIEMGLLPVLFYSLTCIKLQLNAIKKWQDMPHDIALKTMKFGQIYTSNLCLYFLFFCAYVFIVFFWGVLLKEPLNGLSVSASVSFAFIALFFSVLPMLITCLLCAAIDNFELKYIVQGRKHPELEFTLRNAALLTLLFTILLALLRTCFLGLII